MVHSHTVHLPLGALLIPCTMCATGLHRFQQYVRHDLRLRIERQAGGQQLSRQGARARGDRPESKLVPVDF